MLSNLPMQLVPIADIHRDPTQPRKSTNLERHETLRTSIAEHGILHPLLVRRDAKTRQLILIAGESRWLCAKELELDCVPCRIVEEELTAAEVLTLQLLENLMRQDLNPMDEARSLKRLQDLEHCTQEELATLAHVSTASICRSFKLLQLPPEIQTLLEMEQLPVSVATELHACCDPAIQQELAHQYVAGGMICANVTRAVRQANASQKPTKPKTWTLTLVTGVSLRLTSAISLKDCEQAVVQWLRQLRTAKAMDLDMEAFIAAWQAESGETAKSGG